MSWTLTKKLDAFAGPGEIKRRDMSWTLTKKSDAFGCAFRRDQEERGGAGPTSQPRRDQEQGGGAGLESWTSFASVVSQRRSYGHCLCDSVLHSSWDSNCAVRWSLLNAGRTLP